MRTTLPWVNQRNKTGQGSKGCWSKTHPVGREHRSASEKSSCVAGVLPALPRMAGQGQTGRQNENLLPRWLATPEDDDHREHAIGSDHQGCYRDVEVLRRVLECQLRAENAKKDAAQGGGVETDSPCSETQTDEGIR